MTAAIKVGLKGVYKLGKKDAAGNILAETDWIDNLLTDYGLNSGFTGSYQYQFCAVGSGNTAPSFSDTQLVSQLGARSNTTTNTTSGNSGASTYYYFYRRTFEFPLSGIIGNVAEVGLFSGNTGANAFSRSLAKDSGGTPITFPVLSGEQLYVIYELREYRNQADVTGNLVLESISYPYLLRSCNIGNTNSIFNGGESPATASSAALQVVENATTQPATGAPSSSGAVGATSNSIATYVAGTFYQDITYNWTPASAVFGTGIQAFLVRAQNTNSILKYAIYMTGAKIPKTNTKTLTITIRWAVTRV